MASRISLQAASNYANALLNLKRSKKPRHCCANQCPRRSRVLGENDQLTLKMRKIYARALYEDASATLDDLREAAVTLGEMARIARRVFGGAHPMVGIEYHLRIAMRAALRARGGNG